MSPEDVWVEPAGGQTGNRDSPFPVITLLPTGLWFSLDVSYSGSFLMTLETKMNLIRLGKEDESSRLGECGKDG